MTKYYPYGVSLSKGQLEKLSRAYNNNSAITIRLARNELSGPHELMLTKTQISSDSEVINRLDQVCKLHDIDYSNALSLSDKHSADQKNQSLTERAIKNTIKLKKKNSDLV